MSLMPSYRPDGKESACSAGIQVRCLGQEDFLEKETATHFSVLGWRVSWTEQPGGLQSLGVQTVGHDCATTTFTF